MKKNRFILIIALLLAVAAAVLYFTRRNGTIRKELRDFAVKDTASISKIFLADRSNRQITLERQQDGTWKLNGKGKARPDAMKTLLYTMAAIDVRSPVARSAHNTIVKNLAAIGVKVEIYQRGELTKTYYVGGPTQDQLGTFMLLEGSSTPFVMHIPGFNGYLTPRYFTIESDWKDRTIFAYRQGEIKSVAVSYNEAPDNSFVVEGDGTGNSFTLKKPDGTVVETKQKVLKTYIASYRKITLETYDEPAHKDSVLKTAPAIVIQVSEAAGKTRTVNLYHKPNDTGNTDPEGNVYRYDNERMYATVNDEGFCIVQFYMFNKLLKSRNELAGAVSRR
jgi:hypothetical protein